MAQKANVLITELKKHRYDSVLKDVYVDEKSVELQRVRYIRALNEYVSIFGDQEVVIYSAPGRSEVGGNHTDHQCGKVLAASVNVDLMLMRLVRCFQDQVFLLSQLLRF